MKKYIFFILISFLFDNKCVAVNENTFEDHGSRLYLYIKGNPLIIKEKKGCHLIEFQKIFVDALILSDDLYWKLVSSKIIETQKAEGCLEIIFKESQTIQIGALNKKMQVKKILLPLKQMYNQGYFEVYFGDPEYDEFNVVINRNVKFKELVFNFIKKCNLLNMREFKAE